MPPRQAVCTGFACFELAVGSPTFGLHATAPGFRVLEREREREREPEIEFIEPRSMEPLGIPRNPAIRRLATYKNMDGHFELSCRTVITRKPSVLILQVETRQSGSARPTRSRKPQTPDK